LQIDGKCRTVYGKSEREVRAKLRESQRDVESIGGLPASEHHTLNELLDAWVANAPNLEPSTIAKNRWFLDTCVRPTLGDLRLDKVTPDRLQTLYSELTPAMAEKVHRLLHRAFAVAALERQQEQQAVWKKAAGSSWEDWGLVFTGETGKPLFASTIQHALKHECARLALPAVTPHGFRHLHASLLLHEGVPVTAVSARLGHANPQITLKIYAHALPGQDKMAAEAISNVLGERGGIEPDVNLDE
jgi:integrase